MENTADETSLFCLEIFVDTVDYLLSTTRSSRSRRTSCSSSRATRLWWCRAPTPPQPNAASCDHAPGQEALPRHVPEREERPVRGAAHGPSRQARCRPLQVLALSSEDAEIGTASGRPHRRLRGSCAVPMAGYHPPAAGLAAARCGAPCPGRDERAVPVKDSLERTVAVALVAVTVSAMNGQLKDALFRTCMSQQRGVPPSPQTRAVTGGGRMPGAKWWYHPSATRDREHGNCRRRRSSHRSSLSGSSTRCHSRAPIEVAGEGLRRRSSTERRSGSGTRRPGNNKCYCRRRRRAVGRRAASGASAWAGTPRSGASSSTRTRPWTP